MKVVAKAIVFFLISVIIFSCESDDDRREERCRNFLNKRVSTSLNLNLPSYADLQSPGNDLFIEDNIRFIQGVYIAFSGIDYRVFELAEPNNPIGTCSSPPKLVGTDLVYMCGEKEVKYEILNGTKRGEENACPLLRYRAERSGNLLIISN